MRTYNSSRTDLFRLPNNRTLVRHDNDDEFSTDNSGTCPHAAPVRTYDVTAVLANTALRNHWTSRWCPRMTRPPSMLERRSTPGAAHSSTTPAYRAGQRQVRPAP